MSYSLNVHITTLIKTKPTNQTNQTNQNDQNEELNGQLDATNEQQFTIDMTADASHHSDFECLTLSFSQGDMDVCIFLPPGGTQKVAELINKAINL